MLADNRRLDFLAQQELAGGRRKSAYGSKYRVAKKVFDLVGEGKGCGNLGEFSWERRKAPFLY